MAIGSIYVQAARTNNMNQRDQDKLERIERDYRREQLEKIPPGLKGHGKTLRITAHDGGRTNWLQITDEEFAAISAILTGETRAPDPLLARMAKQLLLCDDELYSVLKNARDDDSISETRRGNKRLLGDQQS